MVQAQLPDSVKLDKRREGWDNKAMVSSGVLSRTEQTDVVSFGRVLFQGLGAF